MNAASDHFDDLDDRAPPALRELAALTLKIGYGYGGDQWGREHVEKIWSLWKDACLQVDEQLHLTPDWGEW